MLRFPPWSPGGAPWRRMSGGGPSAPILVAVGAALIVGYLLLVRIAALFQNLFQSTYLLVPGARIASDYWRSVDYGVAMAVLIGVFAALLLLVAALEVLRFLAERPRR
jgi:hypothetical protein